MKLDYINNLFIKIVVSIAVISFTAAMPAVSYAEEGSYEMVLPGANDPTISDREFEYLINKLVRRNKTIEDSSEWIENSYKKLNIRSLKEIPTRDFAKFRNYLDNGSVYIIVHPAFYPFFHYKEPLTSKDKSKSVVDLLLEKGSRNKVEAVLHAQERRMRDFIEFKSTQKKLIILIILNNFREYSGYVYKEGADEYTRYLNEITNGSPSVVYLQSGSATRGYLLDEDQQYLMEFLVKLKPEKLLLGGSYVGRCLEDFYLTFVNDYGRKGVFIVPELSDVSPSELTNRIAKYILLPDGTLNVKVLTDNIYNNRYGVLEKRPMTLNLP